MRRLTVLDIQAMKIRGDRIPMITAYDYPGARLADSAGFPIILVGDSLGMVVLGFDSTIPVTVEHMVHHTAAVSRGSSIAQIVSDMPFMSYRVGTDETLRNAGRLIQEGGAQAVKLEGGESVADEVKKIVESGIPVMGHLGLTPQSLYRFGGYRVQGKAKADARKLLSDALAIEEAGAYSLVLELVPSSLSRLITQRLSIPTIGIGAGPHCDGQVQVLHDILAFYPDFVPKHTRQYANLSETIMGAFERYVDDVKKGSFPTENESFQMDESFLSDL